MFFGTLYRIACSFYSLNIIFTYATIIEHQKSAAGDQRILSNGISILPNITRLHNLSECCECYRRYLNCDQGSSQCLSCKDRSETIPCCPSSASSLPKNRAANAHWLHRFSLWNMWYFWFIMVMILATCFTGCNYFRRQRRSQHFRLFQRQYTTIAGNGARNNSDGAQIVIPITMYEVSPDTILRLMRDDATYRNAGSPRFYDHQHQNSEHQQERHLQQAPPSYGEVTSKPNMYPPKVDESEPPSYASVSQSVQQEPVVLNGGESGTHTDDATVQERRLS